MVNRFPADKEVTVYYNPFNKKQSVLVQGVKFEVKMGITIAICIAILGCIIFFYPEIINSLK